MDCPGCGTSWAVMLLNSVECGYYFCRFYNERHRDTLSKWAIGQIKLKEKKRILEEREKWLVKRSTNLNP